ncbi:transporter substrate-binding domain-containing protein [Aquipseudomonas campi]|uniref:Transporter substrate-binding domain-containing protein n=1 Tax=Aquipseudomonas campi TaxID=2731681 RepID=A0A6M8FQB6_9GAMM|nr:transporter substrate-binding domain-containing protein [Pseudomonas campi]QKE62296.1 transporter substrate-binding domain-containing protein [Pseudomonas campi]
MNNYNKRYLRGWLVACVLLSGQVRAAEVHIVLFNVEPYSYLGSDGQPTGIQVEKVRALAEQAGLAPRIDLTSFARRDLAMTQGDADMTIGFETEALKKSSFRLGPIMTVTSILLLRQGLPPSALNDLSRLRVGRMRGGCADLRPNGQAFESFHDFNNYGSGLSMLQSARLDVICATDDALRFAAQQAGIDLAAHHSTVLTANREVWIFVARQVPEAIRQRIEQALNASSPP